MCAEQIIDTRTTLRYIGILIIGRSQMLSDNESLVKSFKKFHTKLHAWYNILSLHWICEIIAADICWLYHIRSDHELVEILNTHWSYNCVWKVMIPILLWTQDTTHIQPSDTMKNKDENLQLQSNFNRRINWGLIRMKITWAGTKWRILVVSCIILSGVVLMESVILRLGIWY